ncbi:MAG: class I SAM-dependent methyltransferase [Acidimicrobiales bacterium]
MTISESFADEVSTGQRFEFGKNWASFLSKVDAETIANASQSFQRMLGVDSIEGLRLLDAGSGSGLSSLVARRLGASVVSFDYDPSSVECTLSLKNRYQPSDDDWQVSTGSVLDAAFLQSLGSFDIVYSWGVLHHTGSMWEAMGNVAHLVRPDGRLFIMIYPDIGWKANVWRAIKKTYCRGRLWRYGIVATFIPYYVARGFVEDVAARDSPLRRYRTYPKRRGMSRYHDWIDWLGGYPYEVANEPEVSNFLGDLGFRFEKKFNNEYVYRRTASK